MNKVGWNFPSNNYGQINGISDAGIETFRGALISSLTRETCQNSLDAIKDINEPVRIEFEKFEIYKNEIPGYEDLLKSLQNCYVFWKKLENEKTYLFFEKAIKSISKEKISVLRISDFNTKGLSGSKKEYNTPWQNLVKANGVSDKNEISGGSFGIGKAAPFACSDIRTVFYQTLDEENISASQGIARLVSYKNDNCETTSGVGYFGIKNKNLATIPIKSLNKNYTRKSIGTDLFIINFIENKDWDKQIIIEMLEGFLLSFFNNKIEVSILENGEKKVKIGKNNIGEMIKLYREDLKFATDYYRTMISKETKEIEENFMEMGTLKLKVLLEENLNRNILISRNNGMKLFDKNRISRNIQFSGVLTMKGNKLNAFFREMESPQHNSWEFDRHREPKYAKEAISNLNKWIKEKIFELGKFSNLDELDAAGIGDYIPDFFDFDDKNKSKKETITNRIKEWEVKISDKSISKYNIEKKPKSKIKGDNLDFGFDYDKNSKSNKNSGNKHKKNGRKNSNLGLENNTEKTNLFVEVGLDRLRLFLSDIKNGEYTLSFMTSYNIKHGFLEIKIAGEQSNFITTIKNAKNINNNNLKVNKNKIYISNIKENTSNLIKFTLDEDDVFTLEVKLYEN